MNDKGKKIWQGVTLAAIAVAIVLALPLLGVAVFVLRFVLIAAALVAAVGLVVGCTMSSRLRQRLISAIEPEIEYKGIRLASDVAVDRGHTWARVEPDGAFVGVDDLAEASLGPVGRVRLPVPGSHVRRGDPLFALERGGRRLQGHSPVDGTVIAVNETLYGEPTRVNRDPFGLGWVARLRPDEPRKCRKPLLRGLRAQEWFRHEVDRLLGAVGAGTPLAGCLPDGGQVVSDLHRLIDEQTWSRLSVTVFGGPQSRAQEDRS